MTLPLRTFVHSSLTYKSLVFTTCTHTLTCRIAKFCPHCPFLVEQMVLSLHTCKLTGVYNRNGVLISRSFQRVSYIQNVYSITQSPHSCKIIFVLFYVLLFLCCSMYCLFCVVLGIVCFVSFCVLFVCNCVLYYCHRVATQLQLTNISYHIIYHISYHIIYHIYHIIYHITYHII